MLSALYYLFLVLLCTFFMILSALALVLCYPFDKGRRVVHELSRILVRIFFFVPPFWRQKIIGRELIDRKKRYVIVVNHNTVIDIPALYYIPLNFRWVAIFPEGTRSKDGEIGRFKAGAFTLAKEAGVDILPVVMTGTKTLIKKNLAFNWGNRITVRVLPPVPASEVAAAETHELMQTVRDRMCEALAEIRKQQ